MEWPKLKNIMLILLVFTNLCLAILVMGPELQSYESQRRTRLEAIAFLEEKGISIREDSVPMEMELCVQVVLREQFSEKSLATALLGEEVQEEQLGGEVYRYQNGVGAVQFHNDGSFSAQLEPSSYPITDDPEQVCLSALKKLGFEGEIIQRQENALRVRQTWEGAVLFGQTALVSWNEIGLVSIEGNRLMGTPNPKRDRSVITVPTALITYLNELDRMGDVYSGVQTIIPGYISTVTLSEPVELIPVWQIITDTGVYQLNTISGKLSRMS